jgi:uncharacterized protein GlcG (DUF336 family)
MTRFVSALLLGAMFVTSAMAQPSPGPAPAAGAPPGRGAGRGGFQMPPPVKGPAGPFDPVAIPAEKEIPFAQAAEAAHAAVDACLALPRKSAAAVMVVDLNGNVRAMFSPDGTSLNLFDFARRKAYTVLKKKMASADFATQPGIAGQPFTAVLEGDANLITFGGGLPIMKGGEIIGALSVSGPTGVADDTKCAQAGMAKFHF